MDSPFKLALKFLKEQAKMHRLAEKYGRTDPRTIKQSQKVDKLVVQLQVRRVAL